MTDFTTPSLDAAALRLERLLADNISASERESAQQWLLDHSEIASVVEQYRAGLWNQSSGNETEPRRSLARLHEKLVAVGLEASDPRPTRFWKTPALQRNTRNGARVPRRAMHLGLWAGITATVCVALAFFVIRRPEMPRDVTRMYTTNVDQQAIVNIDKNTRILLAPNTILRLQHFSAQSRTVELESGEAYFEVGHAEGTPFVIHSGDVTTQVLGTAFLIRHDLSDSHVRVAVTEGKVRVVAPGRVAPEVTLTSGQVGDVTRSATHVSTTGELTPGTEWGPGRIMFRDTPIETVLQTVSRWYGYHFRYADQILATRTVTMMVSTRSSTEALTAIEQVLAVKLKVVGDTVTLVPEVPRTAWSGPRIRTYDVWTAAREVGP